MQTQYEIVIADTSCFILLHKIEELKILESVFGSVVTTHEIAKEFGLPLPEWVKIRVVKNVHLQSTLDLDAGEASAIALALESGPSLLILDDGKGRKAAKKLNLRITGTLGVFIKAKELGIISKIRPLIEKVQQTNFRFSEKVFQEIMLLANE